MERDIDYLLETVGDIIRDARVPVVDLIAVQTEDPYKILVATILSARTKDETTAKAAARLFKVAPDAHALATLPQEKIEKLIYPVGFFRNKAGYLSQLPKALDTFGGAVPQTMKELLTLPGVGRKTANLVLAVAFQIPAICVDTHVHRIMNIWGYVQTATPLQTEMALRKKLPQHHWLSVNTLLVSFGQYRCRPISPHCDICPLQPDCPQHGVTPRKAVRETSQSGEDTLRFISWNVNGIRAIEKKGFIDMVQELDADVLALQETKAHKEQLSDQLINIPGYTSYWHSAEKKGYSSVAIYSRVEPIRVITGMGEEQFDREGRVLTLEMDNLYLINVYFPNSGEGLKRLDYKLNFNARLLEFARQLSPQKTIVICGDYNVAHKEIDLKNPKNNVKNAGFTPEERAWMTSFLEAGFVDSFREFNQEPGHYSWWSYRFNARARDIGWRIDYFCIDEMNRQRLKGAAILKEVMGSDHCPVQIDIEP